MMLTLNKISLKDVLKQVNQNCNWSSKELAKIEEIKLRTWQKTA